MEGGGGGGKGGVELGAAKEKVERIDVTMSIAGFVRFKAPNFSMVLFSLSSLCISLRVSALSSRGRSLNMNAGEYIHIRILKGWEYQS